MNYYFYTTQLIQFIFSYTQCTSLKVDTFYKFWDKFQNSCPDSKFHLDFDRNYNTNYSAYDNGFDQLDKENVNFIYLPDQKTIYVSGTEGNTLYNPTYADEFLRGLKMNTPKLATPLLIAIQHIRQDIDRPKDSFKDLIHLQSL